MEPREILPGEPLRLTVTLANEGKEPFRFEGPFALELQGGPASTLFIRFGVGPAGTLAEPLDHRHYTGGWSGVVAGRPLTGTEWLIFPSFRENDAARPFWRPGTYEVWWHLRGRDASIISNAVRVVVRPPPPEEEAAFGALSMAGRLADPVACAAAVRKVRDDAPASKAAAVAEANLAAMRARSEGRWLVRRRPVPYEEADDQRRRDALAAAERAAAAGQLGEAERALEPALIPDPTYADAWDLMARLARAHREDHAAVRYERLADDLRAGKAPSSRPSAAAKT